MQTKINATPAIGIPGEFVNTNLRRVDSYLVGKEVTLGGLAFVKGGLAYPDTTDGATLVNGVFVSTHQHVAANGPADGYRPTLAVAPGNEIGVATMGDVFVEVALATTTITSVSGSGTSAEAAVADAKKKVLAALNALSGVKRGDTVYHTAAGAITAVSTSNTVLGTVVHASDENLQFSEDDVDALVTITQSGSGSSFTATVAMKSGAKVAVTAGVRIG